MYIDNNYFEEKNNTIKSIEIYFESHPLDAGNIAKLVDELVFAADDIEQLVISDIIFFYAIWKKTGAIPALYIRSIKMSTYAILQFNPTFTHLNADEYKGFIKMVEELSEYKDFIKTVKELSDYKNFNKIVKELSESKIEILGDNR